MNTPTTVKAKAADIWTLRVKYPGKANLGETDQAYPTEDIFKSAVQSAQHNFRDVEIVGATVPPGRKLTPEQVIERYGERSSPGGRVPA
jgi:hypothetical protein